VAEGSGNSICKKCGDEESPRKNHAACYIPSRGLFLLSQLKFYMAAGLLYLVGLAVARCKWGPPDLHTPPAPSALFNKWCLLLRQFTTIPLPFLIAWDVIDWCLFLAWFLKAEPEGGTAADRFEEDTLIAILCCGMLYCGPFLLLLPFVLSRQKYVKVQWVYDCLEIFIMAYASQVYEFEAKSKWLTVANYGSTALDWIAFKGPAAVDDMLKDLCGDLADSSDPAPSPDPYAPLKTEQ